jgi:hypothetical protein
MMITDSVKRVLFLLMKLIFLAARKVMVDVEFFTGQIKPSRYLDPGRA